MTDIEVLLGNGHELLLRCGTLLVGIWALYYFLRNLFSEAGRNPVRIAISVAVIVAAAAVWKLVPTLVQTGSNTGDQVGGGGGGAYSMTVTPGIDTTDIDQRGPTGVTLTAAPTTTGPGQLVTVGISA